MSYVYIHTRTCTQVSEHIRSLLTSGLNWKDIPFIDSDPRKCRPLVLAFSGTPSSLQSRSYQFVETRRNKYLKIKC